MRTKTGIITSNKMQKTIVVKVTAYKAHPKYKKRYMVSKKFYAHCDDSSKYNVGDEITIGETRPISKLKKWKVISN
jgi:small subunit ribosomal protein S17